jgi:hypothetical protein
MRAAIFILLLTMPVTGCFQTENSSSQDAGTYGNVDGTADFLAVRTIFSQSCGGASCHGYHTQTELQLKTAGLFIANDPDNSKLYYRLVGSSGSSGPKNMPSGGALSSSDVQQIRYWILNAAP